jgi:predicted  nucleic acid-binding Zn-ribbon protein
LLKIQLSEKTRALGAAENKLANKSGSSTDLQRELKVVEDALNQHKRDAEKFGQAVASLQADREKYRVDELELQSLMKGKTDADRMIESLETEISDLENNLGRKERELEARLARS